MPNPNPALLPSPALFDVTTVAKAPVEGTIERVALDDLELAPNPRKHISHDSIQLARRAADANRTADPVHRPPPRPRPADRAALRRTAPPARRQGQPRARRHRRLRRPRASPAP